MKFATLVSTTVALVALGASANAVADSEAAHSLYPRGSLARAMLNPNWGKGAFGGTVSAIPASEAGMEIDRIVTIHSTITITRTRSKSKRDHAPTATSVAKKDVEEEHVHAHGHAHGHTHHHHHHNKQQRVSEMFPVAVVEIEKSELTSAEEAKLLNDAFSLEILHIGD